MEARPDRSWTAIHLTEASADILTGCDNLSELSLTEVKVLCPCITASIGALPCGQGSSPQPGTILRRDPLLALKIQHSQQGGHQCFCPTESLHNILCLSLHIPTGHLMKYISFPCAYVASGILILDQFPWIRQWASICFLQNHGSQIQCCSAYLRGEKPIPFSISF